MARASDFDWYLTEWMAALKVDHPHAYLVTETDWSEGKVHNVLTGKKRYDRDIVNLLAKILNLQPYELLMPPELANSLRVMRSERPRLASVGDAAEDKKSELVRKLRVTR